MDDVIHEVAAKHDVHPALLQELIDVEKGKVHLERRRGAKDELRGVIEKHIEASEQ